MRPGTTYRIGFSSPRLRLGLTARAPAGRASLAVLACRGYTTFTPGPDGGGDYVLEVVASGEAQHAGIPAPVRACRARRSRRRRSLLRNRVRATGSLDPARLDLRTSTTSTSSGAADVRLDVTSGLRFELLRDDGQRLGTHALAAATPRARPLRGRGDRELRASPASRTRCRCSIREITSTSLRLEPRRRSSRAARARSGPRSRMRPSGVVEIQVDRFDPLTGWHFNRLLRIRSRGSADLGAARTRAAGGSVRRSRARSTRARAGAGTPQPAWSKAELTASRCASDARLGDERRSGQCQ